MAVSRKVFIKCEPNQEKTNKKITVHLVHLVHLVHPCPSLSISSIMSILSTVYLLPITIY